jgi:hypothetical protein
MCQHGTEPLLPCCLTATLTRPCLTMTMGPAPEGVVDHALSDHGSRSRSKQFSKLHTACLALAAS